MLYRFLMRFFIDKCDKSSEDPVWTFEMNRWQHHARETSVRTEQITLTTSKLDLSPTVVTRTNTILHSFNLTVINNQPYPNLTSLKIDCLRVFSMVKRCWLKTRARVIPCLRSEALTCTAPRYFDWLWHSNTIDYSFNLNRYRSWSSRRGNRRSHSKLEHLILYLNS